MTATDDQMFFTVIKVSMLNIKYNDPSRNKEGKIK